MFLRNLNVVGIIAIIAISVVSLFVSWVFSKKKKYEKWGKATIVIGILLNILFYLIMVACFGNYPLVLSTLCMSVGFCWMFLWYYKQFDRVTTSVIISIWGSVMLFQIVWLKLEIAWGEANTSKLFFYGFII